MEISLLVNYALRLALIVAEKLEETKVSLNLTDDQFVSIEPILIEDLAQNNQVLLGYGIDLELGKRSTGGMKYANAIAHANDMDSVREKTVKKLSTHLSDEQIQEYRKIQKKIKRRFASASKNTSKKHMITA